MSKRQDHPYDHLRQVASEARATLLRVAGEGSMLEQIEAGDWTSALTAMHATDVADIVDAMREHVRHARAVAGEVTGPAAPARNHERAMLDMLAGGLPLNRKERYYTGTVLPMIVASDGFAHLDRLLGLCGLEPAGVGRDNPLDGHQPVAFFTEYNFAESNYTPADKARFADAPSDADTPDIVIVGSDWLLCIEAKVFHNPRPAALNTQMAQQKVLVDYWTRALRLQPNRVAHVLLIPAGLDSEGVTSPVVTWEACCPRIGLSALATGPPCLVGLFCNTTTWCRGWTPSARTHRNT
jgi:hypothetical protein